MTHTKEPWKLDAEEGWAPKGLNANGKVIFRAERKEDALRIVACVNACEGIDTETLEQVCGNVKDHNRAVRAFKLLDALMTMEVKGHQLQDRLQFSEQGRALLAEYKAIGGTK